ncbi:hypothetical protein J2T17_000999 [Paenibacillus mucilaginosus]
MQGMAGGGAPVQAASGQVPVGLSRVPAGIFSRRDGHMPRLLHKL